MSDSSAPETWLAQGLHYVDPVTGAVVPPISPSTTFARDASYRLVSSSHSYARDENATFPLVEQMLARLEGGAAALLFSSGMAAAMAVIQSLEPGDHIVAPKVMYWGLRNWLVRFCDRWGLEISLYDSTLPGDLERAVQSGTTKLVWIETPCNPTWDVVDIAEAAAIAHNIGARLAVDSTVPTPVLTRPLEHGADIVMHSATKYLNGHGDVVAGALVTKREDEQWRHIEEIRAEGGAILGSFEAWLLQRGMRTLFLRVGKASAAALQIARHFENHPQLERVLYPGLPSHPGHEIARRQMAGGFGGMLSLRVKGGEEAALAVASRLKTFIRATSLGGVESLVEHRYSIEGPNSPIPKNLLRLSIGIESTDDLIADLEQALSGP
ncbi:MAG TPA: aminotransferase class I/II-fold pyridoxal phosphate-dependent enzyme [Woeseiaceae bacterium]|nr:aminotransferase class I/II-fold pyridoxal phosphate-dependent enzyme [Woeseiaceae bacterium]